MKFLRVFAGNRLLLILVAAALTAASTLLVASDQPRATPPADRIHPVSSSDPLPETVDLPAGETAEVLEEDALRPSGRRATRKSPEKPRLSFGSGARAGGGFFASNDRDGNGSMVPISSDNVELISTFPGHLIGGHFQQRSTPQGFKTFFFATGVHGLQVWDATSAGSPVLVGGLAFPHWENEDVDMAGDTLLISVDGRGLYRVDISDPISPAITGELLFSSDPATWGTGRPGHIANCIDSCKFAWVGGGSGGWIAVVDLTGERLSLVTKFQARAGEPNESFRRGTVHDAHVDSTGLVWLTGSGGLSAYGAGGSWGGTPTAPVLVAHSPAEGLNTFILHNSFRPGGGKFVYVGEENWLHPENDCAMQGRFEVYEFVANQLKPVSTWELSPKVGTYADGSGQAGTLCSNHWFDYRSDGMVATSWYEQGVRFLDVTDPARPRERGWWLPTNGTAWASYFHPVDPSIVYVADVTRGLDIIRLCRARCMFGGALGGVENNSRTVTFEPSPQWGLACPRVKFEYEE